jgi:protein SCO1/2
LVAWLLSTGFRFPDEKKFLSRKAANIEVFDANGQRFELFSLLRNKPLIIAPVYTACPSVCGILSNGARQAINELGTLGKDFTVASFSFDSADTKDNLASFESRWNLDGVNWKAISASPAGIQTLTSSMDFQNDYSAATKEYNHPSLLVVLSPEGRISRYIYGINPHKRDIRLAVIEAAAERISPGIFRGLYLRCFAFDSLTKTYRVDWGFIISTFAGLLIISIICTLFIKSFVIVKKSG